MQPIEKKIALLLISIAVIIQTGCWDQKIYEHIGFILQMGLEIGENDEPMYTVSVPVIGPDVTGNVEILSTSQNLLRESREKVRHISGKAVEGGKTQHLYFSKDIAQKGIDQYLDVFIRNSENPLLANVIVVDGSPKEMMELSGNFKDKPRPAFYVNELLLNAWQNSYIPETRIFSFSSMSNSRTIDPTTPILRYNKEEIEIAGIALFSGDKMVGEIDTALSGILHVLMDQDKKIQYMYHSEDKKQEPEKIMEGAAILIKGVKRKLSLNIVEKAPQINIKLNLKASLDEYSEAHNMDDPKAKKKLEEEVADSIRKDCLKLLEYLREVDSDPLGIAEILRSRHNKYWKTIEWKDVYKDTSFNVEVKIIFEFYGAIN